MCSYLGQDWCLGGSVRFPLFSCRFGEAGPIICFENTIWFGLWHTHAWHHSIIRTPISVHKGATHGKLMGRWIPAEGGAGEMWSHLQEQHLCRNNLVVIPQWTNQWSDHLNRMQRMSIPGVRTRAPQQSYSYRTKFEISVSFLHFYS